MCQDGFTARKRFGARLSQGCNKGARLPLLMRPFRRKGQLTCGVSDGIRTRDFQDHNLVLYQLNYTHHRRRSIDRRRWRY
jgi:hypothetical protein